MGLIVRFILIVALGVIAAYAAYDNPKAKLHETIKDLKCQFLNECFVVQFQTLPGVGVYFVDPALATREGRQVAIISTDWPYCNDETGEIYEVPKFFETDFASIPGWAQFYINPQDPKVIGAAIIHDWLYAYGGEPAADAKKRADDIFRTELAAAGVNIVRRNLMYQAVANFGGEYFGADVEMRFRDPSTGNAYTQARPASLTIGQLEPGCDSFIENYWNPEDMVFQPSYFLSPSVIDGWIDLPGAPEPEDDRPILLDGTLEILELEPVELQVVEE